MTDPTAPLTAEPIRTARLLLVLFSVDDLTAMSRGRRLPGWAEGYPREDDVDVARHVLSRPQPSTADLPWLPRHVVVESIGLTVGSVGFFGPPEDGVVEIGYGLVEGARGQGHASEAVAGMVAAAGSTGLVEKVIAHTLPDNVRSQAVLLRNGFVPRGANPDGEPRFERRLR